MNKETTLNLAKVMGLEVKATEIPAQFHGLPVTWITLVDQGRVVFSFTNYETSAAFLLGASWGEGRASGRDWPPKPGRN